MRFQWLIIALVGVLSSTALRLTKTKLSKSDDVVGYSPHVLKKKKMPPIAASIAVHPPKFHFLAKFIESYSACPAAMDAMSIFVVFPNESEKCDFERGLKRWVPGLPANIYTSIVPPALPDNTVKQIVSQQIPAWKKWYGIASMLDMDMEEAPEYGLLLDAELLPYNKSDCGPQSHWYKLYDRIKAAESLKLWPAAQVDTTKEYKLLKNDTMNGQHFDRELLEESKRFVYQNRSNTSAPPGTPVRTLEDQISNVTFSWWTDLPYVNLTIVKEILTHSAERKPGTFRTAFVNGTVPKPGHARWLDVASALMFPRFEHLTYQEWCILHHGYHIKDVTNLTGTVSWASYNEDPKPGSRITELEPMWVSSAVYRFAQEGKIPPLSSEKPPLMIFHVDHETNYFGVRTWKRRWEDLLLES